MNTNGLAEVQSSGASSASRSARAVESAIVFLGLLTIALCVQWMLGTHAAEFNDDDASHYVSGLLVHDYLLYGLGKPPIQFLRNFYSHYPQVGIGHWPPLYYFVEGLWMVVFSAARGAMLLLSATMLACLGTLVYAFTMPRFGRPSAIAATVIVGLAPIVLQASLELMLDTPIAVLAFIAMWLYVRYLDDGRAIHSAMFGVVASLALLIKGNGAAIALLPPLAVLISRRFELLRRGSFWLPVPVAAILAGPWYLLIEYGASVPRAFNYEFGWSYTSTAVYANAAALFSCCGPLIVVAALAGLAITIWRPGHGSEANARIGAVGLLLAVWLFHLVVPAGIDRRFMIPLLAPLAILAVWATDRASTALAGFSAAGRAGMLPALTLLVLVASFLPKLTSIVPKPQLGIIAASEAVWANRLPQNPAVLVVGSSRFEAIAVTELAMHDPERPSLFVMRGVHVLGAGGWRLSEYEPKFSSAAEVMAEIDSDAFPLLLIQAKPPGMAEWAAHVSQTAEALRLFPDRFELLYRDDSVTPPIELYRIHGNDVKVADHAKLVALNTPKALADLSYKGCTAHSC